jgi:chloramphenicol-sensitive protein RarD
VSPALLAIIAYTWWGFVPVYWKQLAAFPAEELILYRVLLSALFLWPLWQWQRAKITWQRKNIWGLTLSGSLIGFNWYLYVWAVNHNHVVDASLGYFLNPLMNVALGTLLLQERMSAKQRLACSFGALGALTLAFSQGAIPWIALLLATSFALYGFVRKKLALPTIAATFFETVFLSVPTIILLVFYYQAGQGFAPEAATGDLLLLSLSGIVTTIPLLAFVAAAKGMPLSTLGFFQFLSPTLQFLLGVFFYREPFSSFQWIAFSLIWLGLAIFLWDLKNSKKFIASPK